MLEFHSQETGEIRKKASTDAAWLSSARGVNLKEDLIAPSRRKTGCKNSAHIGEFLIDIRVTFG